MVTLVSGMANNLIRRRQCIVCACTGMYAGLRTRFLFLLIDSHFLNSPFFGLFYFCFFLHGGGRSGGRHVGALANLWMRQDWKNEKKKDEKRKTPVFSCNMNILRMYFIGNAGSHYKNKSVLVPPKDGLGVPVGSWACPGYLISLVYDRARDSAGEILLSSLPDSTPSQRNPNPTTEILSIHC